MFTVPQVDDVVLECPTLPAAFDGLTILHLSDLHITHWNRRLAQWAEVLAEERPDVVVITGDLGHRSWMWQKAVPTLERFLEPLKPPLGTWFILGNHDSLKLGPALVNERRRMLENEAMILRVAEHRLAMIGLKQHRRIDTDIPSAMRQVRAGDFKLFLMHYPDLIHAAIDAGADVCLAGHTHGGQICYPDGSPILSHDVLPAEMTTGIHRWKRHGWW